MMEHAFFAAGLTGAALFFGRFFVQWLVSEWRGQYTVPIAFWYMSIGGVLLLFLYAYDRESPGGTLGLCFNIVIYVRNLILIWRERGQLTPARTAITWSLSGTVVCAAFLLTVLTWQRGYRPSMDFWAWSAIWIFGQGLFFLRFIVQWAVTEYHGRSIIPASFWYLSLAGMVFHGAYFLHRADWLLALGTFADGIPYARNLWLMRREKLRKQHEPPGIR
ncbi:lipid-A-disaccharide synthase N-terminal domain-containing protein [Roseovarius pacificus]|uniref:lipid-A-disaccharide synthase N-terminal domain-containing protein n=1 Tax=Roseovarius pacificus TaxID=337701 RepID=UPI002A18B61B|nr:lipid-A-disaccharide synthase N-terminal domain-containing protein [Roseovarius pacificus]